MRLLLDLLAATTGLAPPLRFGLEIKKIDQWDVINIPQGNLDGDDVDQDDDQKLILKISSG